MPLVNPHLISRSIASATGTVTAANQIIYDTGALSGVTAGAANTQVALARIDGTGVGAPIFSFTGNYTADGTNIDEWFNDRQLSRMRCTDNSGFSPVTFTLPGSTDLGTAFDTLSSLGLPEVIRLVIEYTDDTSALLRVIPLASPNPQIIGTTAVIVRSGTAATLEVSRSSGTISDYVFQAIGVIGDTTGSALDAIKLVNPGDDTWDASASGTLPSTGVVKGNAYKVVRAPSDGSGRFGEVMQDDDWVVWEGATFTSWSATPHLWFVLPAHEVRRITALEQDFLTFTEISPVSDRNDIVRGADYADTAGEIRLKLYATRGDYSAADLNTTGDIDEFTDPTTQTAYLGIRLSGTNATLATTLPTLYVYADDGSNGFIRLLNLEDDFTFEGDFGQESDYLSINTINYVANETLRVYIGTVRDRYTNQYLDVAEANLTAAVQAKLNRTDGSSQVDEQRLTALESKMNGLFPLTPDVGDLTGISDIFDPARAAQEVDIATGYSLIADYRGASTRYESAGVTYDATGTDVVRYTGLSADLRRLFGFAVAQINEVTLTGTSGTANIDVDGTNYLATFNTDLTTTASDFVTSHATALNTADITVTSNAAVLTFTAQSTTAFTIAAPVNASGDLAGTESSATADQVLMWIVDGSELIPFVDITSSGNFRINNYTPSTTEDQVVENQSHFLTRTSGDQVLTQANSASLSTFTLTNFPANATQKTRLLQVETDVYLSGSNTQAGHFIDITAPAENTAQSTRTVDATANLGPLYNNRNVTITLSYEFRVSGSDLLVDFRLVSAPSDVTIELDNVVTFLSYTAPAAVARVDNFVNTQDGGGDFTFSGSYEFLISFHPYDALGTMNVVPAAVSSAGTVTLLNDVTVPEPAPGFASVEIPDQTGLSGFEFRTGHSDHFFNHNDLGALLPSRATQWFYGLALLRAITEYAFTAEVDFTQGIVLIGSPNNTRVKLIVDDTDTSNIKLGLQEV